MRLPPLFHHRAHPGAKLTVEEVRWMRQRVKSFERGLSVSEQVRRLKRDPSFAMLGEHTIRDVLTYESWSDR